MKRLFDIFFSLLGLIFFSPLFIVVAILIKTDRKGKGAVFFIQKRIGRNFRPFNLYKFKTVVQGTLQNSLPIVADNDQQITRIGRFLRKTKLDGIPQLWNVLKGDMSLIGPMPEVRKYVSKHRKAYREILKIRPGIIDIASLAYSDERVMLKGKKNFEEYYTHILLPEKIKLDREYVKEASVGYDIRRTCFTIFKQIYPHKIILKIVEFLTPYKRSITIGIQIIIFFISNYLAFSIRFHAVVPFSHFDLFLKYLSLLLILRIIFLFNFSLDKGLWKYTSINDLLDIVASISFGSLLFFFVVRYIFGDISYPRSIYIMDGFLNLFLLGSIRLLRRFNEGISNNETAKKRAIVIGAGDAAEMLLRDASHSPLYPYKIIGLIDDDSRKKGFRIRNVPILGIRKELPSIVEMEEPDEFIIAIPSASSSTIASIVKDLRQYGLPIKTIPVLWEVLRGKSSLDKIREVEPEDVLFRAPTCDNCEDLKDFLEGKRVMITGAGGSIGSELSRQIVPFNPESLVLFERHEESLYNIDMELKTEVRGRKSELHSIIGDILDEKRVTEVMERFRPHIVFHAAAYKHVPLMEDNPYEAFKTNVLGTKIVAERAGQVGVEQFILISTDKAVNSVNVMGITKKRAELLIRNFSKNLSYVTKYVIVRFGNVLGSSGSVVPLFKEQIKRGGPVTVTHPEITRFFMTIPEAISLILRAAAMGKGEETFVLDMGKPVKILDLAKRLIGLYGYRPGLDIEIVFTGLRPGEKLHEELFSKSERVEATSHPKINKAIMNGEDESIGLENMSELLNYSN